MCVCLVLNKNIGLLSCELIFTTVATYTLHASSLLLLNCIIIVTLPSTKKLCKYVLHCITRVLHMYYTSIVEASFIVDNVSVVWLVLYFSGKIIFVVVTLIL